MAISKPQTRAEEPSRKTDEYDLRGVTPESWCCADCGINTFPGTPNRVELERRCNQLAALQTLSATGEKPSVTTMNFDEHCEVYTVRNAVWKAAGMEPWGGCLCIGCLEQRLGRRLTPKDFPRRDAFNNLPGTDRLIERRDGGA
jgi:hypothetical protein